MKMKSSRTPSQAATKFRKDTIFCNYCIGPVTWLRFKEVRLDALLKSVVRMATEYDTNYDEMKPMFDYHEVEISEDYFERKLNSLKYPQKWRNLANVFRDRPGHVRVDIERVHIREMDGDESGFHTNSEGEACYYGGDDETEIDSSHNLQATLDDFLGDGGDDEMELDAEYDAETARENELRASLSPIVEYNRSHVAHVRLTIASESDFAGSDENSENSASHMDLEMFLDQALYIC